MVGMDQIKTAQVWEPAEFMITVPNTNDIDSDSATIII